MFALSRRVRNGVCGMLVLVDRYIQTAEHIISCVHIDLTQVPLDGDILYGEALLSMQHITGENLPLRRGPGAQVPAGSQSHDGVLVLRVTQRAEDSTPARISRLARDAQVL